MAVQTTMQTALKQRGQCAQRPKEFSAPKEIGALRERVGQGQSLEMPSRYDNCQPPQEK